MAGGNNPVFDVMYNDKVVFKAEPANGKVYFGTNFWYDPADGAIHTPNDKIVIDSSGSLKATFAEIVGTMRTGPDAPKNTRLGARDRSGVTDGPNFTGSGLDDLSIANEGTVDMLGVVKIESVGHRDLTVTVPLTSASNWTVRGDTYNFANKCFDSDTNRILGAGTNALGFSSDSGNIWTRTNSESVVWMDIAYSPATDIAVAVGYNLSGSTRSGRVAYSTNHGTNWTVISLSNTNTITSVAVNPSGRFVLACTGNNTIWYSDNGATWHGASSADVVGAYYGHIVACNSSGRFVIIASGYSLNNRDMYYSDNGASWTFVSWYPDGMPGHATMSYHPNSNRFIMSVITTKAGVTGINFFYSTNGTSWTYMTRTGGSYYVKEFSGFTTNPLTGYMIGSGYDSYGGGGYIYYSPNGANLYMYQLSTYNWIGRVAADLNTGRFIVSQPSSNVFAHTDVKSFYDKIKWSGDDGATWTTGVSIPESKVVEFTYYGISVAFGSRDGHTINDQWTFTQEEMHGLVIWDVFGSEYLKATDGLLKIRDKIELGVPSLSSSGHSALPNGMIIQWGHAIPPSNSTPGTAYFPIAFPHACFKVVCSPTYSSSTGGGYGYVASVTTTSCRLVGPSGSHVGYIAIGW